jgi:hypothetical protein
MSVTYKFESLASLADYLEKKANDMLQLDRQVTKRGKERMLAERAAYIFVAHMLRHTIIEPKT